MTDYHQTLLTKINVRQATVAVIGLGYVGLDLAVELAKAGFRTIGLELDPAADPAAGRYPFGAGVRSISQLWSREFAIERSLALAAMRRSSSPATKIGKATAESNKVSRQSLVA
jgi:glycine/D-amino acid oxidase-like deaminating enzyme